jgi:hypothetical protein
MESRREILSELQSISPIVAGIVPVTPYEIPTGYFDNLTGQMLELIKEEKTSAVLLHASKNPYSVPDNYFENLPNQILLYLKSEQVSPVLTGTVHNAYEVPQGYFEGLAEIILNRVKTLDSFSAKEELESLSPLLSKIDKQVPFSVPAGYFDDLTGNVVAGTQAIDLVNEELENLSPAMSSLKTANVYTVPAQYFESLPTTILAKAKTQKPAKVVSMNIGKKMMRYATAAIVAGIVITAGLLFINRQNPSVFAPSTALAEQKIQQETLNNVKGLSDDEIFSFLETQSGPSDLLSLGSSSEIDSDDVKEMLADVPESELQGYLADYVDTKAVNN